MSDIEQSYLPATQESICGDLANLLKGRILLAQDSSIHIISHYTVFGHETRYRLLPFVAHSGYGKEDSIWMASLSDDGRGFKNSPVGLVEVPRAEDGSPIFPKTSLDWDERFSIQDRKILSPPTLRRKILEQIHGYDRQIRSEGDLFHSEDLDMIGLDEVTECRIILEDALGLG